MPPDTAAVTAPYITEDVASINATAAWSAISIVAGYNIGKSSLITSKPSLILSMLTAVVLVEALLKNEPEFIETPM